MPDKPARAHKHWTKEEEAKLCLWYGALDTATIARKLQRTPWGVDGHAALLGITVSQGNLSLRSLVRQTGYTKEVIITLAASIGIVFRRVSRTHEHRKAKTKLKRYAITEDEKDRIIAAINKLENPNRVPGVRDAHQPSWGKNGKSAGCLRCRRSDLPHQGRGLCRNCYTTLHQRGKLSLYPKLKGNKQ